MLIYHESQASKAYISEDDGKSFKDLVIGNKDDVIDRIIEHPFDNKRAYAISSGGLRHYSSSDQGRSWTEFTPKGVAAVDPIVPFSFNVEDPDYVLFSGLSCPNDNIKDPGCNEKYFYTKDNFKSVHELVDAKQCFFAKGTKLFAGGSKDTVACVVNPRSGDELADVSSFKLAVSDNYFKDRRYAKVGDKDVEGVLSAGLTGKFFVAAMVKNKNYRPGDEIDFLASTDLEKWVVSDFNGISVKESAFTVLESTQNSLHVVVSGDDVGTGTFFTSNSDGTYFTKSLEKVSMGMTMLADLEKIWGIDGILIANVVDDKRNVRTKISYNDGRNWEYIQEKDCSGDSCTLNFHSVQDFRNIGRIFSSPAPGILGAVGNTGSALRDYEDGDFYISHDSGRTWEKAQSDARLYAFGDQGNIILSAFDEGPTNEVHYSVDGGDSWEKVDMGEKLRARILFTNPDATTSKFVLLGRDVKDKSKYKVVMLDFGDLYSRNCDLKEDGSGDFEKWYARYDDAGDPSCIMGHKQFYWRKKRSAECFAAKLYDEQLPSMENCKCTIQDYECDARFVLEGSDCVPNEEYSKELAKCKEGEKYKRSSGYRLLPGNTCEKDGGVDLEKDVEQICGKESGGDSHRADGKVKSIAYEYTGSLSGYLYLKSSDSSEETIFLRNSRNHVYVSHDQGATWDTPFDKDEMLAVIPHKYFKDTVYLINQKLELIVSTDRGKSFHTYSLPSPPSRASSDGSSLIGFHPDKREWLIFHADCDGFFDDCAHSTYYSTDNGKNWKEMGKELGHCNFITGLVEETPEKLVFCKKAHDGGFKLVSSEDFFSNEHVIFDNVIDYALEHEFIVAATVDYNQKSLQAMVSVDGENFAHAQFPADFKVDRQQAYTILESVTHAIFMHVTVNSRAESEYGALLKSNYNGTEYVMSLNNVNRNEQGYVDFEKMLGLEGVAVVNTVANPDEAKNGAKKKLQTKITHNDGAEWSFLPPPEKDSDGNGYCSGPNDKCALHLHGFTERVDYRDTFSSQSAVGLMIGVGNVGEQLTDKREGNTYLTRDGGLTWKEIKKGPFMWEFGDSGSIVVIVNGHEPTNVVYYSTDEGANWKEYKFSDKLIQVDDIGTIPSDMSRRFLLFAKAPVEMGDKSLVVQLDFSGLTDRQCVLDSENPDDDDFELWSPSHPMESDNCLFGHEAQYHRKIPDRDCYIGRDISGPHKILKNCTCTRRDFECDFNYQLANDGSCQLVSGLEPLDPMQECSERPDLIEYWEPTGYRRVPMSTCQGGKELDKIVSHPCPGKEGDYEQKHRGLHGFALAFVILLPIGMTLLVGSIIWDHYARRYGQIRLGEEDDDQPAAIRYAVIAVASVVAVASVIPSFLTSVWNHVRSKLSQRRFTSRSSFRRSYAPLDHDEGELLGPEDDDLEISDEEPEA